MIAIVNQSPVHLIYLPTDQSGQEITIASGTVRVFTLSGSSQSTVLSAAALESIGDSMWSYQWEPATLPAGQYFVRFEITGTDENVYTSLDELFVDDTATPANVIASQTAVQADVAAMDTAVAGYVDASQTAVQADVAALDTAVDGYVSDSQTAVQASVAASQSAIQLDVADVQTGVDAANAAISDVENAVLSDQELDAENNQIVLTNPVDHTTVIARFDTTNADGDPAVTDVAQRVRV